MQTRRWLTVLWIASCAACQQAAEVDDVGVLSQALSPCDEAVPANRNVDGIPAYAQCDVTQDSAIYSNNGIDVSTTSMGSDWVRTQYGGGFQCTEFAHRYWHFKWNVKWIPNGNAGFWCDDPPSASSGVVQTMVPSHGDVMVLAPGSCGADGTTGHVNVVDVVDPGGTKLTAVEQNGARRGQYNVSCAKCFLHIMANDGKVAPGGAAGGAAAGAPATGAAGRAAVGGSAAPSTDGPGRAGAAAPTNPGRAGAAAPTQPVQPATPPSQAPVAQPAPSAPAIAGSGAVAGTPQAIEPPTRRVAEDRSCSAARIGSSAAPSGMLWLFGALVLSAGVRRRTRRRFG